MPVRVRLLVGLTVCEQKNYTVQIFRRAFLFRWNRNPKKENNKDLKNRRIYKFQIKTAKMRVWSLALVVVLLAALATPSPAPLGLKKG